MNKPGYILANVVETGFRGFPFPCKTGLLKIGHPDRHSPVFLTCNFHLTVERVKKALQGIDCYLLIANSKGINVWCASTGGHLNNHSVISVIKTSGIEELVDHRQLILPQLAASGVEAKVIHRKTGWKCLWGPVYASDIPAFLDGGLKKTPEMRQVRFPLSQRVEMAVMWAFPLSLVVALLAVFLWRKALFPLTILIWTLSLMIFLLFPVYERWLNPRKQRPGFSKYTIIFDFSRLPLAFWVAFMGGLFTYGFITRNHSWTFFTHWGFASLVIILLISIDLMGSTPVYKSGLHEDRLLQITLDREKCRGAAFCEQVCPRNCYEVNHQQHKASVPRADQCVQCGACIVQCPFDALYFRSPSGEVLPPEMIRKFKLNLMGKRLVKTA